MTIGSSLPEMLTKAEAALSAVAFTVVLFAGMLACLELGRRIGRRRYELDPKNEAGLGVVETAVFGLFGLLIAFTFSGAVSRFDARRELIAREANAIGTAYLRLDLLPPDSRQAIRRLFPQYLDARLAMYNDVLDRKAVAAGTARSVALQQEIWAAATAASAGPGARPDAGRLLLPALNEMIDITTTRWMGIRMHPPVPIYGLLVALALLCSLLAGHSMAANPHRSWLHLLAFAAITVITIGAILDIEYPRIGLIRIQPYDQVLIDLRASMK